jgi:predicted regulator of Ras-like GTPase activity (Roadblock/LC7/MglB family)
MIHLSLRSILDALPPQIKGRVKQTDVGDIAISIPLDKVLSQLAFGSVKITFGELRHAAPQFFSPHADVDQSQIALPLNEILAQINPGLLSRRQNQKNVEVPEEIRSPFSDNGQGLIFSVGPSKAPAPAPAPMPATPARVIAPAPNPPAQPLVPPPSPIAMRPIAATPSPAPVATPAPAPVAMPSIPFRNSLSSSPTPPPPMAPPAAFSPPAAISIPSAARGVGATPSLPPVSVPTGPMLNVPLAALCDTWPESLRSEIVRLNLTEATVAVPMQMIKEPLQRGKIYFPWKIIRSWIKPPLPQAISAHDNTSLELPLRVIAPLFLAREKEDSSGAQKKVAIDERIPNLFFGFPQAGAASAGTAPAPAACAVTKPVDTNYYSLADAVDAPAQPANPVVEPQRTPSGTAFISRCATPNEIVSRAAALNGVAGALIALPDGLMVASKLAPDLNGDTLAAFLPQLFNKVSQCTKELRMGELNNLNFTVGNVPWKIFRVNAIFFAAFGRPSQPLPTAELAALAGELDRRKQ